MGGDAHDSEPEQRFPRAERPRQRHGRRHGDGQQGRLEGPVDGRALGANRLHRDTSVGRGSIEAENDAAHWRSKSVFEP